MLNGSGGHDAVKASYKSRFNTAAGGPWEAAKKSYFQCKGGNECTRTDVDSVMGVKNIAWNELVKADRNLAIAYKFQQRIEALHLSDEVQSRIDNDL